jgi:hypothetical protein
VRLPNRRRHASRAKEKPLTQRQRPRKWTRASGHVTATNSHHKSTDHAGGNMHCSVSGCTSKNYGNGYCLKHYKRMKRHGSVELPKRIVSAIDRYLSRVTKAADCWSWNGAKSGQGYGVIRCSETNRNIFIHRLSYSHFNGPIPDGMNVLHKCDNPECSNPEHLFIGTQKDNVLDMMQKGRKPPVVGLKGQLSPRSKLTWEEVRQIKKMLSDGQTCAGISRKFGVTPENISAIKLGKTWKE